MSEDPLHGREEQRDEDWAALSSMVDGEAGHDAQERCLALWGERADARERWRHYQLIGDVLRSRELAREGAHDAAFLTALRARLAREPVVLRPAPAAVSSKRLRAWSTPVAAAAGVAAVAGVVAMLRTPVAPEAALVANGRVEAKPAMVASAPPVAALQAQQPVTVRLIRDAKLERYFAAHRQSGNFVSVHVPGGSVRSVETIVLEDR
jgi:sigma-E factor negative regulatory protein RseA